MAKWREMAEDQYKGLRGPKATTGQCRPWIGSGISIGFAVSLHTDYVGPLALSNAVSSHSPRAVLDLRRT